MRDMYIVCTLYVTGIYDLNVRPNINFEFILNVAKLEAIVVSCRDWSDFCYPVPCNGEKLWSQPASMLCEIEIDLIYDFGSNIIDALDNN